MRKISLAIMLLIGVVKFEEANALRLANNDPDLIEEFIKAPKDE
jgi:hypothetical protein